jgi:DNA-binding MarR family transcriptional regulator
MSIDAMQWALRQPLSGCQKFVLFMLSYHANQSRQCWPGLDTIAKECGISRATVICHINEISRLKLISKKHRHDNRGYRRSTMYTLHLDDNVEIQGKKSQRRKNQRRDFDSQRQDIHVSNVQNSDGNIIESTLEQSKEHKEGYVSSANQSTIKNIFMYWQEKMNHPQAKLDSKRQRKIADALKDYSAEQLMQAIDGCAMTPYNMGENKTRQRYDDIELILRDASHIERFINNSINPPSDAAKSNQVDIMAGVGYEKL